VGVGELRVLELFGEAIEEVDGIGLGWSVRAVEEG